MTALDLDQWLADTRAALAALQAIEEEQEAVIREGINAIRNAIAP